MKLPASRIILEVGRAALDVRRGVGVLLQGLGEQALKVTSAEYRLDTQTIADPGHPAVHLMKIAGLLPQAVVEAASAQDAQELLSVHADAIRSYPEALAASLRIVSEATVPLKHGGLSRIIAFRPELGHAEHLAVVVGKPETEEAPYVRLHSSCITGDMLGSLRCDCGDQLQAALVLLEQHGSGVIIYLNQEGRGIGIANKLRAYTLQDEGMDTVEANLALGFAADERDFALGASMLKQLGIAQVTLITNNPAKAEALRAHGITVKALVPLIADANEHNERYLATKASKLGHRLPGHFVSDDAPLND